MSYSLGLQVGLGLPSGQAAAGAAVARGPQIDLLALPAEQGPPQAADPDACAAPFDPSPWRGGTQPARSIARLLAAPVAHDPAAMTERTIRSAFAVIVAAQPDDLVSVAVAHPTVWTAEQVTAATAAAASTAPPTVVTQLVPVAVAVAADYCTMALLGAGDAVLVCDVTASSFEVTAVRREGDRLVLLGDRAETPSVGVNDPAGPAGPAGAAGGPADDARLGDGPASGLWASEFAGAVGRALQHARLQGVAVVDVVVSGAAAREGWLQQAAAHASGLDRVLALPSSAVRGAAHLALAAAPAPPSGYSGDPAEPRTEYAGVAPVPAGDDARLVPPPAHPAAGPLPAGAPWLPPPPAPPRQPRAGRAGAGRAGGAAVVLVVAVVTAAAILFAPSLLTLRSADPAPQAPPVVVVPAPSPGDVGASTPAPSVAPSRAAAPAAAVAESVDHPTVLAQVPVGSTPGFAATPPPRAAAGQPLLYVANRAAGVLTVVDTTTTAVRGTIPIGDGPPQYIAFSPDGTRAYVSVFSEQNNAQNNTVNRVVVVDTLRGGVVASIPVGTRPYALAVTPDAAGSEVWVPNHDAASISIIDTATNTVTKTLPVAPNPHWVAFSPDGNLAYTANHESNLITVLDVATKTVVGEVRVGRSPHSVAVSPTEPLVANVNYDSHSVSIIDTRTNMVTATIAHVGAHPQALAWAPDGRHLYTANVDEGTVSVINTESMTVTARIPTGKSPTSVAVDPSGQTAYVTNLRSGTLTVLKIGR